METRKFESIKFDAEQSEWQERVIKKFGLIDEDREHFVVRVPKDESGKGEKKIFFPKGRRLDLLIDETRVIPVNTEDAIETTIEYPDLPLKEALTRAGKMKSENK